MRQSKTISEFYSISPEIMSLDDRLDYSYWHPKFNDLIRILSGCKYNVVKLSSLVINPIISGTTPPDYIFPMKGIMFLGSRNVRNGKLDLSDISYIEKSVHDGELKSSKINKGDVLITMAGSVGRCAVYDLDIESNISQSVVRIQLDKKKMLPSYLVYYLNSSFGQSQFERNRHDVDQPNINTTEIGEIEIICPPNNPSPDNIQEKIVNIVRKMENELNDYREKQKEVWNDIQNIILEELQLKTPVLQHDYFIKNYEHVDDRLDFVWNHPLTTSLKNYLKTFNMVTLKELIRDDEIEYGLNAYGTEKGKIPFINVENLKRDSLIDSKRIRYLDKSPESKLLKENDLLISRSRTVGICAVVTKKEEGFTFGSYTLRFRINDKKISPIFVANFINSQLGQEQIRYMQTGSRDTTVGGGNNINPEQLKQLMIVLPKNNEQMISIVNKINELLKKKNKIEEKLQEKERTYQKFFEEQLEIVTTGNTTE